MNEVVNDKRELQIIQPAVRDVVAERIAKAKEQGIAERAHNKIRDREDRERDRLQNYYKALKGIMTARFSFGFHVGDSYPAELREYDRLARREAWKLVAWCFTIVPLFYFAYKSFDYEQGDLNFWNAGSFLKNRKYFLRDVAEKEKRLCEKI